MNLFELASFLFLALSSNTAFPLSFDPVLISFAAGRSVGAASLLAVFGSGCAGLAALADVKMLRFVRNKASERWFSWMPDWTGRRLYTYTFLFALMPLPFSVVRLAVLRHPPRAAAYALAVAGGRLPRYLLTILVWSSLPLPTWSANVLLWLAIGFSAVQIIRACSARRAGQPDGAKTGRLRYS